jgi:hypothetical protein
MVVDINLNARILLLNSPTVIVNNIALKNGKEDYYPYANLPW